MAYLIAIVVGLVFGAGDQYLGTLAAGSVLGTWSWTVSGMSAPWLILPFAAGMTQDRPRRAMALGFVITLSALAGYFAMTYSPMESIPVRDFASGVFRMVTSMPNPAWILAGAVSGPLFGWLGHRWRVARSWVAAAIITVALCFEPLARLARGSLSHPAVWAAEVAIGVAVGLAFVVIARRSPAAQAPQPAA
jgi:hypothetical protein